MPEPTLGPTDLPEFLVKQLHPEKHGLTEDNLVTAIQEIEIETQILGASFIKVHVIDPEWKITTSGLVKVNEDGLLNELEVEFPHGTGYFWRLCAVEGTTEPSTANLILTFEDRVVANLREQWGQKTAAPGTNTRAEFIKARIDEANLLDPTHPNIHFVSPGLHRKEPVAEAKPSKTAISKQTEEAAANKERGVHPGAEIKIKGQAATPAQLADINTALEVANKLNAGTTATLALFCAGIGESDFTRTENTAGHKGIWQSSSIPANEVAKQAEFFLKGGESFAAPGAIKLAQEGKEPGDIATKTEVSGEAPSFYGQYLPEAEVIVHSGGGIRTGGTNPTTSNESDVGQLSRGTTTNPDEDSWDCIVRLAQQVNWDLFTDGKQTVFFMDGPDLIAQKPVLYIDVKSNKIIKEDKAGHKIEETGALIRPLSFTYDNTTFEYRATHKVKQRIQRKSKISKPQTPSEVRMLMLCGLTEYHAGDVFVFRDSGPISENGGRWIVADATRETMKYPYTKFILVPPTLPLPEPKAEAGVTPGGEGAAGGAAAQAKKALTEKSKYRYVYGGGRQAGVKLFGPEPRTMDCSSFVTLCYKEAGLPDPNGLNYSPIGATQTMIENMKKTSTPQPGDLAFFGELSHTTHVNIVVGGGKSISMGQEGDPSEGPTETMGPSGFLGVWTPK